MACLVVWVGRVEWLNKNAIVNCLPLRPSQSALLWTQIRKLIAGMSAPSTGHERPDCPTLPPQLLSTASSSPLLNTGSITLLHSMPSSLHNMLSAPSSTSISVVNDFRPRISTVNASSHSKVFIGTNINYSHVHSADLNSKNPLF